MLRRVALRAGFRFSTLGPLLLVIGLEFLLSSKLEFHGMWHYALAVGGGLIALETWQKGRGRTQGFLEELKAHWVMSLGSWTPIAIVGVLSTGLCAPWTFLQSLVSVTACSAIWVPVALLCLLLYSVGLEHESARILEGVQGFLYAGMEWFHEAFSSTLLWLLEPSGLLVGVAVVALLALLRSLLKLRLRELALFGCLLSLGYRWIVSASAPLPTDEAIVQWDVRQGDAALVRVQGQTGMIDAGSARAVGLAEWIERLATQRVRALDWILLTHPDEDHSGGLESLRLLIPIGRVIEGSATLDPSLPFRALFLSGRKRANGEMWGVWVELKNGSVYLNLGDADREMERRFARALIPKEWRPEISPVRILKVSHHGSATSTDPVLLERFRPTDAWISSGGGNRFGHPRVEILRRLKTSRARLARTDQAGDLIFRLGQHSAAIDDQDIAGQP
jgi:competence protein ComEC